MTDATDFLLRHVAEAAPLAADYHEKYWATALSGRGEDAARSAAAKARLLELYSRPAEFAEVRRLRAAGGADPLTDRQLTLLDLEYSGRQVDPAVLADIAAREEAIEQSFNSFRALLDGESVNENTLRRILKEESDVERRRTAWEGAKQVGRAVAPAVLELIERRNVEACRLGYRDHYAMALAHQELDESTLFTLLGRLKELTEAPFRRIKADIDRTLAARYRLSDWNSRPWLYADPFFQESPPGAAGVDLDAVFADQDVEALTVRTFEGVGLPIRALLPRSDFVEREGKNQHAFCLHVDREGDVRVLCNVRPSEYWMSTMLHEFGHAVYDAGLDFDLPWLLRSPAHTMTTEAVAMLFGRLTRNAEWLTRVAGVPATEAARLAAEVKQSLVIGQVIFARWGLLMVHFEREMYRDPRQDLNRLWWRMARDFQGVEAPPDRNEPDWASKIHLACAPVYYQNYLLGEMTASQLESAARDRLNSSGTATLVDSKEAGRFLSEQLFRQGARRDWNDTMRHATGAALDPEHWIRQFVAG
ncbi:MAG TPA: M2 family metallopeptidase [Candidatus Eisenbacteria bacterium]